MTNAKKCKWCFLLLLPIFLIFASCKKEKQNSDEFQVREWKVDMNAAYTIPTNTGKTAHAWSLLYLMDNNKLYYDIYFNVPSVGDNLSAIKLYKGNAAENGTEFLSIDNPGFADNKAKGSLQLTQAQADSLKANGNYYMVVNSTQSPNGLVRGQVDKTVTYAIDVDLLASNITPVAPVTTANGKAYIRVLSDNSIITQVVINNLPVTDALTTTNIIKTIGGATLFPLAAVPADYNIAKTAASNAATVTSLKADNLNILVKSTLYPNGLLKGTIR